MQKNAQVSDRNVVDSLMNFYLNQLKRMVSLKDNRIKEKDRLIKPKKEDDSVQKVREQSQVSSALFFS